MSKPDNEQTKAAYNALPAEQKQQQSYYDWVKSGASKQYENWKPWLEDQYLRWFTKDNKASYATRDTLDKSKVTGISQVDTLQDGVHNLAASQVGQGGLAQPIGDFASKEGVNRAEREGKDGKGSYGGPAADVTDPVVDGAKRGGEGLVGGAKSVGGWLGGQGKSGGK